MENADVANDLNKYYFLTTWIETCTATSDYVKKKKLLKTPVYKRGYLGSKSLIEMDLTTHTTGFTGPQPAFLFCSLSLSLSLLQM